MCTMVRLILTIYDDTPRVRLLHVFFINGSTNHHAAYLTGSGAYFVEFRVPHDSADGVVVDVAVSPWWW